MKKKLYLLSGNVTVVISLLLCVMHSLPLRAQHNSDYLESVTGDTTLIMPASSINTGVGYEKGLFSSYRLIGSHYLVEFGLAYNPFFNDKFVGLTVNLGMMPLSTRWQSGLFYSANFVLGLFPIETENKVSVMSLNVGWLSQYQKGVFYSIAAGPGLKLNKLPNQDVKTSFTVNAEASVGISF